jgi:ribosomal protein S18 acetylase RimI-like enzyme
VNVRRISPDEGPLLRDIRLRALRDSPTAFAMTHEEEAAYPAELWDEAALTRSSSPTDTTLFCEIDETVVGLVGGYLAAEGWFRLVSMWVEPESRGRGVGRSLTEALVDVAGATGAPEMRLWVNAANGPAIGLYRSIGFTFDGAQQPLPSDPEHVERRMRLDLTRPAEDPGG